MRDRVPDISRARVLISNDDGVHAPGLKMLEKVMRKMAKDVWVVAPETEQSAAAHSLTLRRPLRIRKLTARRFAVDGTPTDSVLMGINQVMKDNPPDLVLSGVNRGGNIGDDVTYSGTVAVAMEATILGAPAIAFSQDKADGATHVHWPTAEHWIPKILKRLKGHEIPISTLINVNFPDRALKDVNGIVVARQGARKTGDAIQQGTDPRGRPYYWIGWQRQEVLYRSGTDLHAMDEGMISITPLTIDLTDTRMMKTLKDVFK